MLILGYDCFCFVEVDQSFVKHKKMTKKNVVVSDSKSGIEITVPVSDSSLFTTAVQKPSTGGYMTISRKKLLHNLDINGGGTERINTWVDSMRASSPTHYKSGSSLAQDHLNSWMVRSKNSFVVPLYIFSYTSFLLIMCNINNVTASPPFGTGHV